MPTQKIFKRRVRERMTKTGESYTAARRQLLLKTAHAPEVVPSTLDPLLPDPAPAASAPTSRPAPVEDADLLTSDDSMRRKTGKGHAEWFALLDGWGATGHTHTEIARWLAETHDVPGWWTQNITVAYERARGMRARHQMRDGYSISVTKTVATDSAVALGAFTDLAIRERWLPDAPMERRPTRAALAARFDWSDPASRVVVGVARKGPDKVTVAVAHERIPDAAAAERLKTYWRERLAELKTVLERG
jgi:hypothetical protein